MYGSLPIAPRTYVLPDHGEIVSWHRGRHGKLAIQPQRRPTAGASLSNRVILVHPYPDPKWTAADHLRRACAPQGRSALRLPLRFPSPFIAGAERNEIFDSGAGLAAAETDDEYAGAHRCCPKARIGSMRIHLFVGRKKLGRPVLAPAGGDGTRAPGVSPRGKIQG